LLQVFDTSSILIERENPDRRGVKPSPSTSISPFALKSDFDITDISMINEGKANFATERIK